jgi:hypothetical protein
LTLIVKNGAINVEKCMIGKVYISSVPNLETGGTELLHQLGSKLRQRNLEAYIYYPQLRCTNNPMPERFKEYGVDYVTKIPSGKAANNVLIVPEISTYVLRWHSDIRKVVWWLSVDYYKEALYQRYGIGLTLFNILRNKRHLTIPEMKINVSHYAQSFYAIDFLNRHGITDVGYLSDFISRHYLGKLINITSKRENIVLYNPKKGLEFTQKIVQQAAGVRFVPLENLSPKQMIDLFERAKVYIDFGHHPGKDRIPREAAILGCCVIVGTEGSANFIDDVPIEKQYKFAKQSEQIPGILAIIEDIFSNYQQRSSDFETYRQYISNEEAVFEESVDRLIFDLNK